MGQALGTQSDADTQVPVIWEFLFQMENTAYSHAAAKKHK